GGREAATALLNAYSAEQEPGMRNNFRTAIVHSLQTKEAAEALRQGLQHRDPAVRAAAAAGLGRMGWAEAVAALIKATKDADLVARLAAIEALRGFAAAEAVDCLLKLAAGDDEAAFTALWALEESGNEDARILELARGILGSGKSAALRMQAAHFLGARRDAGALKGLLKLLADRDWKLRATAVEALANLRRADAVGPLIDRLDDEDGRLAADVAGALARITGVAFGRDAKKWREWWKSHKEGFQPPAEKPAAAPAGVGMTEVSYHDIPVVSKRLVFVLDVSSSMAEAMSAGTRSGPEGGPAGNTRLDFCKWELAKTIRKLPKDVRFNIVTFGSDVHPWKDGLAAASPAARADALAFVEKQAPAGATNLYDALQRAFQDREADTFYVLSDGQPTDGAITNSVELLAWVRRTNAARGVVIHTISAGELVAVTDNLLKKLAEENRGRSVVLK
ncbi:MAG: HEAT repeat domain-containing protein, partial [Planctomycetes bacterium]|nr:HEAT repeat domain-containing protein [Planctomycetota bacterium]